MALSKKDRVLMWLDAHLENGGPLTFDQELVNAAQQELQLNEDDASRFAQRMKKTYWNDYVQRNIDDQKRSLYPHFYIIDDTSRRFEPFGFHLSKVGGKKHSRLATRLGLRPSIHRIINKLDDREYEAVCCYACQVCGAKRIHLTPKGDEGGVDFFALFEVPQGYLNCTGIGKVRVVGQAKLHNSRTPVGDIRDFNDTLQDIRKRSDCIIDQIPTWFSESDAPIVGWFVSHAGFQEGSFSKGRSNGLMLLDSRTLVEMIALSPNITPRGHFHLLQEILNYCRQLIRMSS